MMRAADPSQDPLAVPISELQHWAGSSWPGPGPQSRLPELTTEQRVRNLYYWWCCGWEAAAVAAASAGGGGSW